METLLLPFMIYYWLLGLLLPVGIWVIVTGIIFLVLLKLRFDVIKSTISILPRLVRVVAATICILGIFATMPSTYLYGAIGGQIGATVGTLLDGLLQLPWPIFRILLGVSSSIISGVALIAWALIIWYLIGGLIGFVLNLPYQLFSRWNYSSNE